MEGLRAKGRGLWRLDVESRVLYLRMSLLCNKPLYRAVQQSYLLKRNMIASKPLPRLNITYLKHPRHLTHS